MKNYCKDDLCKIAGIIFGVSILLFTVGIMLYTNIYRLSYHIDSDIVAEMNYATLIFEQGTIFPKGWYYANELSFFRPAILMGALYKITGRFLLSQSISVILSTLLCIFSLVYLLAPKKKLQFATSLSLVVGLFLGGFGSDFARLISLFYGYYAFYFCAICLTLGHLIRVLNNVKTSKLKFVLLLFLAFILGYSGLRMLIFLYLPILLYALCDFFINCHNEQGAWQKYFSDTLVFVLFNMIGLCLYLLTWNSSEYLGFKLQFSINNAHDIIARLTNCLEGILIQIGFSQSVDMLSLSGISNLAKLGFYFFICIVTKKEWNNLSSHIKQVIFYLLSCIFCIILVMTFTNYNNPAQANFYFCLVPILIITAFWGIVTIKNLNIIKRFILMGLASVVIILSTLSIYQPMIMNDSLKDQKHVVAWLNDNKISDNVYSTFWTSGVISALSENTIQTDTINTEGKFYNWLRYNRWTVPSDANLPAYLIVNEEEEHTFKKNSFFNKYPATKATEIGKYRIYKFSLNPFVNIYLPDTINEEAVFNASAIGMLCLNNSNVENHSEIALEKGLSGVFMYGPYLKISNPQSKYRYKILVEYEVADQNTGEYGVIDIYTSSNPDDGKTIIKDEMKGGSNTAHFDNLSFEAGKNLEIRASSTGASKVTIKHIKIVRTE